MISCFIRRNKLFLFSTPKCNDKILPMCQSILKYIPSYMCNMGAHTCYTCLAILELYKKLLKYKLYKRLLKYKFCTILLYSYTI